MEPPASTAGVVAATETTETKGDAARPSPALPGPLSPPDRSGIKLKGEIEESEDAEGPYGPFVTIFAKRTLRVCPILPRRFALAALPGTPR